MTEKNPPIPQYDGTPYQPSSSDYPGVVGATPESQRGIQGYDVYGRPVMEPMVAQRRQIEQSLPPCSDGYPHDLRMHYTKTSLAFAILILPYLCGYRGRRKQDNKE
ncbi:hypothetical protein EC973_007127 [Apophysomyces ossiformis]|uniref:Uncharacterized protein n=1 Tax=Apophysomyces ossiformis TaxID=679940 RepID=A0A8H7BZ34_9FUNG|nr:hypothetical protein EC973_007127 [Apophysomyces ossiformis]